MPRLNEDALADELRYAHRNAPLPLNPERRRAAIEWWVNDRCWRWDYDPARLDEVVEAYNAELYAQAERLMPCIEWSCDHNPCENVALDVEEALDADEYRLNEEDRVLIAAILRGIKEEQYMA